ncbi:putative late blight resistance protein homolog R1A-3 [Solanum lycopersicum]|uniref:Uncharacterized protein n=1 Tax=Solanum lycopersicum TaxID=4081 RepID=A0A3Q7G0L5_SOLLC|nr:putative late blight resistance protein homolog R1B-16 [Solanum lycopersicum]
MAATYGALTSVLGTIEKVLRSNHREYGWTAKLKSLYELFDSLLGKCDVGEAIISKDLLRRIKDVAVYAEYEVESLMNQLIIVGLNDECCGAKLDYVCQHVIQVTHSVNNISCPKKSVSPRLDDSIHENFMEGYNEERKNMVARLTYGSKKLQVVSVVGMAGIGKTTFAKTTLFDINKEDFPIRGWITVSENYDLRELLLRLLRDVIEMKDKDFDGMDNGQLAAHLKQVLQGKRYLIVVDDIWSNSDWDNIRHWFPDCGDKSRILLTSRDKKVGAYAAKDGLVLMRPLTQDESRNLFYHRAFGKNNTIRRSDIGKFKKVGEKVITNCKGLPLMITAVAGILRSKSKLYEWMEVAESVSSLVNDDAYKQCLQVVALSYNNLPSLMKACFLHFGVFPKSHGIPVKKLTRLWIAEGLVYPNGVEEFEQAADRVLHDLIGKSVVIVDKLSWDGKIKTCRIHDVFHDFCSKESESENLLCVCSSDSTTISQVHTKFRQGCRWMSVQSMIDFSNYRRYTPIEIPSFYMLYDVVIFDPKVFHFKLLRVLDLEVHNIIGLNEVTRDLVCLRYLAVGTSYLDFVDLPITNLWNLHALILGKSFVMNPRKRKVFTFPEDIWQMTQLRHLYAKGIHLCSPGDNKVLGNLQSVSGLSPCCCTKEIFEGIKKVKKLVIRGTREEFPTDVKWIDNLKYLQHLESVSIENIDFIFQKNTTSFFSLTSPDSFPQKLKELKLRCTYLPWECISIISKLPELEVLKLKSKSLIGNEWKATDQVGFPKLRFLLLDNLPLTEWENTTGSHDHFPSLERLIITNFKFLEEIPQGFADSKKLELIELHYCNPSLVDFAKNVQVEHEEVLGRNKLKVTAFNTGLKWQRGIFASRNNRIPGLVPSSS